MGDLKAPEEPRPTTADPSTVTPAPVPSTFGSPALAIQDQIGNAAAGARLQGAATHLGFTSPLGGFVGGFLSGRGFPQLGVKAAKAAAGFPVIELKGTPYLDPGFALGGLIRVVGGGTQVWARFGDLAEGEMIVAWRNGAFQAKRAWLKMNHPELQPRERGDELGLAVTVTDGLIEGEIGVTRFPPKARHRGVTIYVVEDRLFPILFGHAFDDLRNVTRRKWRNELSAGALHLDADLVLQPPDGPEIEAKYDLLNEKGAMDAAVIVKGSGLADGRLPLTRTASGLLTGRKLLDFSGEWKGRGFAADAKLTASFVDGSFDARGRVKFAFPGSSPRLSGDVNVVLTSSDRAWEIANSHSPTPLVAAGVEPLRGKALALTGWGSLNLVLTKGVGATAAFVVDPDGYLTAKGVLRTPREIPIIDYKWTPEPLFDESWELADKPLYAFASFEVEAEVTVTPGATIGVTLRDILVQGLYSTRPGVATRLDLAASLNISAEAWLKVRAGIEAAVEAGFEVGLWGFNLEFDVDVLSAWLGVEGTGSLKAYVEARPRFTMEGAVDPAAGQPKYRIGGRLDAAGQIDVSLAAAGDIKFFGFGPSGSIDISKYPIGSASLSVDLDHVIGSGDMPKVKFDTPGFNPRKFVDNILERRTPSGSGRRRPPKGEYRDRRTGEVTKIGDLPPKPLPKAADPSFELRIPFEIDEERHELFLALRNPPVVEIATKRKRLKKVLEKAAETVEVARKLEADPERLALREQQAQDLQGLASATTALEADADKLEDDPALLSAAELPGVGDLATQLAEYGERYNDPQVAGIVQEQGAPEPTEVAEVQPVWPGTNTPAGDFDIAVPDPYPVYEGRAVSAQANWKQWERLALEWVRNVYAATVPSGLALIAPYDMRHPANPAEWKKPEGVFLRPDTDHAAQTDVIIIEATLNATFFAQNRRGRRHETGEHKIDQIPRTLHIATALWPRARIRYVVISNVHPGETTASWLRTQVLNPRIGVDVSQISIDWIALPLRPVRPPGRQP